MGAFVIQSYKLIIFINISTKKLAISVYFVVQQLSKIPFKNLHALTEFNGAVFLTRPVECSFFFFQSVGLLFDTGEGARQTPPNTVKFVVKK